jgi:hypothetical protein
MSSRAFLRAEMAEIAAAAGSVDQRAEALLGSLRGVIPYAAAWIGVRDPETRAHRRVGSDGDVDSLTRYFALPEADDELEAMGLNRFQPPVPASALPVPSPTPALGGSTCSPQASTTAWPWPCSPTTDAIWAS